MFYLYFLSVNLDCDRYDNGGTRLHRTYSPTAGVQAGCVALGGAGADRNVKAYGLADASIFLLAAEYLCIINANIFS